MSPLRTTLAAATMAALSFAALSSTDLGPAHATSPATPLKASAAPATYIVKNGDHLLGIATKVHVRLADLLAANKLTAKSVIQAGQVLVVPPTTATTPTTPAKTNAVTPVLATKTAVRSSTLRTPSPSVAANSMSSQYGQSISTLLAFLRNQVGKPYVFNTAGPDTYDCSGLVVAAYSQLGIALPHQSLLLASKGTAVDVANQPIVAGDLILMYSSASPGIISHVGIAMDSTTWIQAAKTGTPVYIGPIPMDRVQAVRRIIQPG